MTPPPLIAPPDADMTTTFSFHGSGVNVVSGVSGTDTATEYRGPWYIEEQSLNISYWRMPNAHLHGFQANLSSVSWSMGHTQSTSLACFIEANVVGTKDWGTYTTSSWSQPQTFKVYAASADTSGQTYGDLTASSFGPAGEVVTKQKYYSRVPWNDASGHSEFNHFCKGSNSTADRRVGTSYSSLEDPQDYPGVLHWAMKRQDEGGPLDDYDLECRIRQWVGNMNGSYSPLAEYMDISTFLETTASWVMYSALYAQPANGAAEGGYPLRDTGVSTYQKNRHDYSVSG